MSSQRAMVNNLDQQGKILFSISSKGNDINLNCNTLCTKVAEREEKLDNGMQCV